MHIDYVIYRQYLLMNTKEIIMPNIKIKNYNILIKYNQK